MTYLRLLLTDRTGVGRRRATPWSVRLVPGVGGRVGGRGLPLLDLHPLFLSVKVVKDVRLRRIVSVWRNPTIRTKTITGMPSSTKYLLSPCEFLFSLKDILIFLLTLIFGQQNFRITFNTGLKLKSVLYRTLYKSVFSRYQKNTVSGLVL